MNHETGIVKIPVTRMQRYLRNKVHEQLSDIQNGSLRITDSLGETLAGEAGVQPIHLRVHDLEFYHRLVTQGSIGAAESYMDAEWETNDLTGLVRLLVSNINVSDSIDGGSAWLRNTILRIWHRFNRNTETGSKRNISAHYDLGNDFFRLFLDKHMMYSSAIYTEECSDLESASTLKLKTICEKLDLSQDDHVIEIGTGWGGFACYAASEYGCRVTTTTISRQQYEHAKQRVDALGLADKVTVLMQDYRELEGQYDKLVSIEMIEAVGHQYLPTYLEKCQSLIREDGLALIQAITIDDRRYRQALKSVDFIKRYIFPGSFIPCVSEIVGKAAGSTDLRLINLEDFGESYARTLADWRQRFMSRLDDVRSQGFDERFIRMWEFYLCYCEGGFEEKQISDVHLLFSRPHNRRSQWLAQSS